LPTFGNGIRVISSTFTGGALNITANTIQNTTEQGIYIDASSNITVGTANNIGTDVNGTVSTNGNGKNGILITNTIGANSNITVTSNLIAANGENVMKSWGQIRTSISQVIKLVLIQLKLLSMEILKMGFC
jgi:hypothetical protein